jgi:hypothetical protein
LPLARFAGLRNAAENRLNLKGENVPAPLTLQVSHVAPTISDQENSEG